MSTQLIDVSGLSVGYGAMTVVRDFSMLLAPGESVAVLGRNGVGKTTLVRGLTGHLQIQVGTGHVLDRDVQSLPSHHLARDGLSYLSQTHGVFDDLTVDENLRLACRSDREYRQRVSGALEAFPLFESRLAQRAGTLSGGQRKLLMMARLLMQRPRLIIADEVAEGVQPSNVKQISAVLRCQLDAGVGLLIVEQRLELALELASRYHVLKAGETVVSGEVDTGTASEIARHLVL